MSAIPAEVERLVDETGPVDIIVNNAGIPPEGFTIKSFAETDRPSGIR